MVLIVPNDGGGGLVPLDRRTDRIAFDALRRGDFLRWRFRSQNVDWIGAKVDSLCCGNAAGGRGASSDGAED
jgi:hypothetical protein